ncbi:MAG: sensor histidine kinase [Saprospiraceae bacterium]
MDLSNSEQKYQDLFENGFNGILTFDIQRVAIVDVNQKLLEYFKLNAKEELLTRGTLDFSPEFQPSGISSKEALGDIIQRSKHEDQFRFNWLHQLDDGTLRYTDVSTFRDKKNKHLFTSIFRDITHEKQQEQIIQKQLRELNQKNQELQRYIDSNMHLENFAYLASHDLKSPMRSMISFSQLLKNSAKGKLSDRENEYLNYIITSTKNMQSLINDLLAYSVVSSQNQKISDVNVPKLIDDILFKKRDVIKQEKANITLLDLPIYIRGDKSQLKQLFSNLIDNALKFSKKGESVNIQIQSEELENNWKFSIIDTGIGIPAENFEKVFLIFKKNHSDSKHSGTGIGLAICNKVIRQHKGEIWLESEVGKGSNFSFILPKKISELEEPSEINDLVS